MGRVLVFSGEQSIKAMFGSVKSIRRDRQACTAQSRGPDRNKQRWSGLEARGQVGKAFFYNV